MTTQDEHVTGEYVSLNDERYYRIENSHLMPDFFMSLVGASDHWMFISSSGALTAGRQNADNALFPYAADDQISAARSGTGSTTLVRLSSHSESERKSEIWDPFGAQTAGPHVIRRNLYKTPLGNKLVFEEINESLQLVFRYRWTFSERFGFVRSCRLQNISSDSKALDLLDGLQNVLPYGVGSDFTMRFSNLANAYKKSELIDSEIGLFYLSSIPTDRAEPSEGLKTTTVWQNGLSPEATLLSAEQIPAFRDGRILKTETDIRGKAGAYLVTQAIDLGPGESIEWEIVAELAQDHSDVIGLCEFLRTSGNPRTVVAEDISDGEQEFLRIISSSDGLQCSANPRRANRHLSNTVFNLMRGGVPLENYNVHVDDFVQHVANFNRVTHERNRARLEELPTVLEATELRSLCESAGDPDLTRLALEYLPLAFGRRHGDPTRPWNRFSIDLRSDNGRTNLNYQGNWRDIFQNWEALAVSFPEFSGAMICRFVNATTADGYNPYRITKHGFEWEEPTPDDPWANIGYWGDHQIIYLLKLLELNCEFHPGQLLQLLNAPVFVHANVPYRIKSFEAIKKDARSTIDFDAELSATISARVKSVGADGKLLRNQGDEIHRVTLLEKLLTLSLAKLSNFVPDGGIWLNTQRPEWNDANNALVGNGLSMVTTCYLHRWFKFLHNWISSSDDDTFRVSQEVAHFFERIGSILTEKSESLTGELTPERRLEIVTALSTAGSEYRESLYATGVSGQTSVISREECLRFFEAARQHIEVTIRNNRRPDGLYHAYNLIDFRDDGVRVEHLYEMLEGQVAVMSANLLTPTESVELLDTLRASALYRENQRSYLLYPDRQLPRFLEKNQLDSSFVNSSPLLQSLLERGNTSIISRDARGAFHFNGTFRNSMDVRAALDQLPTEFDSAVQAEGSALVEVFDGLFGHRQFTGRSGTFFAYEGLGSIYWHMVSKLGLAASEAYFNAIQVDAPAEASAALKSHLDAIRSGIGAEKHPCEYGAFPSDPYSHTPENAGVKQPGMTGQVKEDVLARFAQIGVRILDGCLCFRTQLFDHAELVPEPTDFTFGNLDGDLESISVPANGFAYTLFQVPIVYQPGASNAITIRQKNGEHRSITGTRIDRATSQLLFARSGDIASIECQFTDLAYQSAKRN